MIGRITRFLKVSFLLLCVAGFRPGALDRELLAQDNDLEFNLDLSSSTISLPAVFKPNIDISGRGFHRQVDWPQGMATKEVLDIWQRDIGWDGVYRIQYNLWEINALGKDKEAQNRLLQNYENIIQRITEAGGIVILDIFSTPAGLGKALDKKSTPWDLRIFKALVKAHIRRLSCDKRYNIWYELWSAPDLDDFFLGRKQEYLNLYRVVAESINELEAETMIHIPLGGPALSWWFQNLGGNTIVTPERSLIYELIKFCSRYRLPLDFISWHAYATDPKADRAITAYNKNAIALIREWLSYFNFDRNTPLFVDEWNYDASANVLPERKERSFVCASYIPSRLKNMYEAGIDYQLYFSLEDFQDNKEGVVRNIGIFAFQADSPEYRGTPKAIYNVFRMLANLGDNMFVSPAKPNDDFVGVISTKAQDYIAILIYNYIDSEIAKNYLSRNIAIVNGAERRVILRLLTSDGLEKVLRRQMDIAAIRTSSKVKALLQKAVELNDRAARFKSEARKVWLVIKNIQENYLYQRYTVDSSCIAGCAFSPIEERMVNASESYLEALTMAPYSVNLIILNKNIPEPKNIAGSVPEGAESKDASGKIGATAD